MDGRPVLAERSPERETQGQNGALSVSKHYFNLLDSSFSLR
jgi:hypothetical protein